jgi:hypothetical protein
MAALPQLFKILNFNYHFKIWKNKQAAILENMKVEDFKNQWEETIIKEEEIESETHFDSSTSKWRQLTCFVKDLYCVHNKIEFEKDCQNTKSVLWKYQTVKKQATKICFKAVAVNFP